MIAAVLVAVLNLAPGIQLADTTGPRHVGLLGGGRVVFVSDDEAPTMSIDQMTRDQQVNELRRIEENRPSLVGPIVLLSIGGALLIEGVYNLFSGLYTVGLGGTIYATAGYIVLGIGAISITVGVILGVIGLVKLLGRLSARREAASQIDELHRRIDSAPPVGIPPPPPPMPPPSANWVLPSEGMTVASF
jgi:hypothetical protein